MLLCLLPLLLLTAFSFAFFPCYPLYYYPSYPYHYHQCSRIHAPEGGAQVPRATVPAERR